MGHRCGQYESGRQGQANDPAGIGLWERRLSRRHTAQFNVAVRSGIARDRLAVPLLAALLFRSTGLLVVALRPFLLHVNYLIDAIVPLPSSGSPVVRRQIRLPHRTAAAWLAGYSVR